MMEQTPPSNAALAAFATDSMVAHDIARRDAGQEGDGALERSRAAMTVDHVSDQKRCYPGEQISFYTRVRVNAPIPGFQVRVQVPTGLEISTYRGTDDDQMPIFYSMMEPVPRERVMLPGPDGSPFPIQVPSHSTQAIQPMRMVQEIVWRVAESQEAGTTHDFVVTSVVLPTQRDLTLLSRATLEVLGDEIGPVVSTETISLAVYHSGRYLEYLPSLYEQDDFMGRFLMLFESFWRPIDQQINEIHNYFDPDMTPARFLPWLASWFDLALDSYWSEAQQRELLNSVMWLYRRRGTRVALQRYLEIFTQEPVEILEKRAKNMRLGATSRLGVGVALGTGNQPHTFTVKLKLRPVPPPADLQGKAAARDVERMEKQRLALIHRMIMAEKPAQTSYRLEIDPVVA